jgi:hypothetical protein
MVRSRVLLSAIFATLGVALAGCAATPLYPGYYPYPYGGAYYCGEVLDGLGHRKCVGPVYQRAGY